MLSDLESLLKDVRDQFLKDVDAKHIASDIRFEGIISDEHETRITNANSVRVANEILFTHLCKQATPSGLEKLCSIMIRAKGYEQMQKFGKVLRDKVSSYLRCLGLLQMCTYACSHDICLLQFRDTYYNYHFHT